VVEPKKGVMGTEYFSSQSQVASTKALQRKSRNEQFSTSVVIFDPQHQ
jgi:hypothetical protein